MGNFARKFLSSRILFAYPALMKSVTREKLLMFHSFFHNHAGCRKKTCAVVFSSQQEVTPSDKEKSPPTHTF